MNAKLKKKKTDLILELALEEQMEHDPDIEKYNNSEKNQEHVFSDEHNKKIQEIFEQAGKKTNRLRQISRLGKMVAGVTLFLCISMVAVTQAEAFRLPMLRFFMEIQEKSTLFGVNEDDICITERFKDYEPSYVPDGFSVRNVEEGEETFIIEYYNGQKDESYSYQFFKGITDIAVDTGGGFSTEIKINGNQAYLIEKGNIVRILLNMNGNQFFLSGAISEAEAVKIMESIK